MLKQRVAKLAADAGRPFAFFNVRPNKIPYVADGTVFELSGVTNWQSSINLAMSVVRQIVQYGVFQDEVNFAVRELRAMEQGAATSSSTRSSTNMADVLMGVHLPRTW